MTQLLVAALGDGETGLADRASMRELYCNADRQAANSPPQRRTFDSGRADATRSR